MPERATGLGVEGQEGGGAVLVVIDVNDVAVDDRRGPGPVLRLERPDRLLPDGVAVEVVGRQRQVLAVPEQGVDPAAVGGGGGRGERVVLVQPLERAARLRPRPGGLAGGGVEAEQHPFGAFADRRLDEQFAAADDRRGVALAGDRHGPEGALGPVERGGQLDVAAGAGAVGAAEAGPVGGGGRGQGRGAGQGRAKECSFAHG